MILVFIYLQEKYVGCLGLTIYIYILRKLFEFLGESGHSGHYLLVNLPAKPIFSKNDLNSRRKIEDKKML